MIDAPSIPDNLAEVLDGDQSDYKIMKIYTLITKTSLCGIFPAVLRRGKTPEEKLVAVLDPRLFRRIIPFLTPRVSELNGVWCYANEKLSIAYVIPARDISPERSHPVKIITPQRIDDLTADKNINPFEWSPGLINLKEDPTREEFE